MSESQSTEFISIFIANAKGFRALPSPLSILIFFDHYFSLTFYLIDYCSLFFLGLDSALNERESVENTEENVDTLEEYLCRLQLLTTPTYLTEHHFDFLTNYFIQGWEEFGDEFVPEIRIESYFGRFDSVDCTDDSHDVALPENAYICSKRLNGFILFWQRISISHTFTNTLIACIIIAGLIVGIESYPQFSNDTSIHAVSAVVQVAFSFECCVKILREGRNPLNYFIGSEKLWNNFDFWLVIVCWLPRSTVGGNVSFLRLLRLLRLLKLVGKVKKLQVLVSGLIHGFKSVTYILLLLVMIFYLFAVLGTSLFRANDPFHFGGVLISTVIFDDLISQSYFVLTHLLQISLKSVV